MSFLKNIFGSKKEETITNYSDFWNWFVQHEKQFFKVVKKGKTIQTDFFDKLSPKLDQLNDEFYFVCGMYDEHTAELIFTPEGIITNIVFIEELVDAAPAINGWKFTALKPADVSGIQIKMEESLFSNENINFYSNDYAEYPDEIDITLVHNDYEESNVDIITKGSYIFLDNLLGELNLVSIIDNIKIIGPSEATKELVPIEKLNDFLIWRQKEFIEKYDAIRYDTDNDTYSLLEAELENGNALIAVINTDLLNWNAKASHPWILNIEIKYDGSENNGMPDTQTYQILDEIENEVLSHLKDFDGYLNIGRQTSDHVREIYLACKEFRKPSKVLSEIVKKNAHIIEISYEIFKDKYWMSLNRFRDNE